MHFTDFNRLLANQGLQNSNLTNHQRVRKENFEETDNLQMDDGGMEKYKKSTVGP